MSVQIVDSGTVPAQRSLDAVPAMGLFDTPSESAFYRLVGMAKRVLDVPDARICLQEQYRSLIASPLTQSCEPRTSPATVRERPCEQVAITGKSVFVANHSPLSGAAILPCQKENAVAYLGVPLIGEEGAVLGTFSVTDTRERNWTDNDFAFLSDLAALTVTEIQLRSSVQQAHAAQTALAETTRLVRRINDTTPLFIYIFDLATRRPVYVNQGISHILGYSQESFLKADQEAIFQMVHPDDRLQIAEHRNHYSDMEDGAVIEIEFRALDASGRYRWLRRRDTVFERTPDGRVRQILGTTEDITKRRQAEDDLRAIATKLEQSNTALQDFVSVASHDLQEPLRKILQFSSLLHTRQTDLLPPEARGHLDRVIRSAERMQQLLADLLAYSRVTSRAQPFRPVNLTDQVRAVVADLHPVRRRLRASIEFAPLPEIQADCVQLRQMLRHLLENALKFHRADVAPLITVSATIRKVGNEEMCHLAIQDNGIGFEQRYAERIFNVFERLHEKERYTGTGMGLAICRRIVERHGGFISAEGAPDVGATFRVVLPVRHEELVATPIPDLRDADYSTEDETSDGFHSTAAKIPGFTSVYHLPNPSHSEAI